VRAFNFVKTAQMTELTPGAAGESLSSARLGFGCCRVRYIATSHFYSGRFSHFRQGH
jgi:hypothetical protein